MKNLLLLLSILLCFAKGFAHQPDVSTTLLVEKENNIWMLQINASLTAFQYEIKTHFSETPYKTPEEFQKMVLAYVKDNISLQINGNEIKAFGVGMVQLGHETKVVYEVFGIPSEIDSAVLKNSVFKDIHKSQSTLIIAKSAFQKEHFVMNDANDHTITLELANGSFSIPQKKINSKSITSPKKLSLSIAMLVILAGSIFWILRVIRSGGENTITHPLNSK